MKPQAKPERVVATQIASEPLLGAPRDPEIWQSRTFTGDGLYALAYALAYEKGEAGDWGDTVVITYPTGAKFKYEMEETP